MSKGAMDHNMITSGSGSGTRRIRGSAPKAGSVWESRMKLDEVKGGIKALIANHDDSPQQETHTPKTTSTTSSSTSPVIISPESQMNKKLTTPKQSPNAAKRKTWKSESSSSPVQISRQRSEPTKNLDEQLKSPALVKKTSLLRNPDDDVPLRNVKSDSAEVVASAANESCKSKNLDEADKDLEVEGSVEVKARSDVFDCEDKSDIVSDVGRIKVPSVGGGGDDDFVDIEDEEIEVEKRSVNDVVKAITVQEKVNPKKIVVEEKKLIPSNERPAVNAVNHAKIHPNPTKNRTNNFRGISRTNSKLQSFVDLVMWRDVSKSAFIFGLGTFAIISSSYSKDLNISFVSVVSYSGLVYLAAIFLFRSLITRGGSADNDMDGTNQDYVVGEEEAIWLIKLLVPFMNEFLLKLKALFSGDPATTMKLAVILFILARCGSSITIWKMAKLGFIGVFTVPKVCSSYSSQLTAYGTFWIRRFKDAWESCSHKKAVGFAIFTLVWNLSSVVARIWAVFMLFVAFKYYQQQSLIREGWAQARTRGDHSCWEAAAKNTTAGPRNLGRRPTTFTDMRKQKKVS